MHRATPVNTSFRSYVAGGARCLVDKADDTKEMQECTAQFLKAEERIDIECPQNYGFTSYVIKSEKENDGQIKKCSEGFVQFMGGNRSFPVVEVMDDRRYRLRNFKEGESAVYDDQQQKVHIQRDRIFTRSQYKVEMRVVKDQEKMKGHGKNEEADRDQYPYPDPVPDHSRRLSTYVMDKEHILIERTDVINDDNDKDKKEQDEPGGESPLDFAYDKHIKMLSRVHLDSLHIQVNTPTISILWDEEKKFLKLNTGRNTIILDDINEAITIATPERSIVIDDKNKAITISGTTTAIKVDDNIHQTRVGTTQANIPAAMLGSWVSDGSYVCGNVAKRVLVI